MIINDILVEFATQGELDERNMGQPRVAAHKPEIVSATDDGKTITVQVRAPDGTTRSMSNSNPALIQQWLNVKYGLRFPANIARKFVGMPASMAEQELDEIDRRGFLKGVGAAAVAGAAGGAEAQTIGAGENESAWASDYAHNMWQSLAKDNNSYNKWLYDTAKSRAAQYFQYSNGVNFQQTIKASLNEAYAAVKPDFDMFYKIAEKEKEDTGLLGTYMKNRLGNRFGVDMGGQAAQQKYAGSMKQFDLRQQVETFVRVYTDSLNQSLKTIKAQTQQSNVKSTSIDTKQAITDGLTLYYYCKDFPNNQACEMIKSEIGKYIKINNLKDSINSYYSETSNLLDSWKANEKDKWEKLRKNIIDDAPNIIQTMQKLNSNKQPEFESVEQGVAEGELNEKSTSQAQFRTMAAAAHNPAFAKKVGIDTDVAQEFHGADRDQDYKGLPKKANEAAPVAPDPQNYDSDWDYYNDRDAEEPKDTDADYENMIDEPSDDWFDESKEKVGNMDADKFDDALARMKKLAGSGPLKTVWDPAKRVYRNMPTAVQPKK